MFERDERPKKSDVLGFLLYENDVQGSVVHRNRHLPNRHVFERQRKDRYVTALLARLVCPYDSRGAPDIPVEFSNLLGQQGIV